MKLLNTEAEIADKETERSECIFRDIILFFFLVIITAAFIFNLFPGLVSYVHLREFALHGLPLFLRAECSILFIALTAGRNNRLRNFLEKKSGRIVIIILVILFAVLCFLSLHSYWDSAWDVAQIRRAVLSTLDNKYEEINADYFSECPNNVLIYWIYVNIMRLAGLAGIQLRIVLCWFQALITCITLFLVNRISKDLTKSDLFACCTFFLGLIFIGLSPWYLIPYSDATALFLPVLIFRLFQKRNNRNYIVFAFLIGFLTFFAYKLKPQASIAGLAVLITMSTEVLRKHSSWKELPAVFLGLITCLSAFNYLIVPSLPFEIDHEKSFSAAHYMMMGLNSETMGGYNYDDVLFSESFETYEERQLGDLKRLNKRISEYSFSDYVHLFSGKLARVYSDGTFGWGGEGGFFYTEALVPDERITPAVYSLIRSDGFYYTQWTTFFHGIWLCLLFSMIAGVGKMKRSENKTLLTMILGIIGLTLFELIFENRARYIYTFAPVYLIVGSLGIRETMRFLKSFITSGKQV